MFLFSQIQLYFPCREGKEYGKRYDLIPLLLVSVNPIIDPWVFIILSPPVPRLLWDKMCKTIKSKPTQEKVRSIHPVLYQKSPPGDSEGGSSLKVYTGIPGTDGSWSLKHLCVHGNDYGVITHPCYENNGCRSFGSLDTWTARSETWRWKSWVVLHLWCHGEYKRL